MKKSTCIALIFVAACSSTAFSQDGGATPLSARKTLFSWSLRVASSDEDEGEEEEEIDTIVTDRPDFTEASSTVGRGTTQLEIGYTFSQDRDGVITSRGHSCGEPLLRVGIWADWFELRAALFPAIAVHHAGGVRTKDSGYEDLYLGCKIGLTEQAGWLPELAIVPQMTVPTGSSGFTDGKVLPGTNLLYGWDINDTWTFAGSTQFNQTVAIAGGSYTEWAQSLTVGTALTEKWTMYNEWIALAPDDSTLASVEHYYNGGFTFLVTPDIQWDIRAGTGLSDASTDFFAGTGLSIRTRAER